jgi:probable addiction module antidote protein
MSDKLENFDITEYLDSKEAIAEYLSQVLKDGDSNELIRAIGHIAKAKGMSQIAKEASLGRESLYKSFTPNAKPRFETVIKVLKALDVNLTISPN